MIQRFSLLPLTILVFAFACSKQGEGQHCSIANVNNDCDDNLICVPPRGANACGDPAKELSTCLPSICCPPRPQRSNVEACNQYQYGVSTATGGSSAAGGGSGVAEETGGNSASGGDSSTGGSDTGGNANMSTEPDAGP